MVIKVPCWIFVCMTSLRAMLGTWPCLSLLKVTFKSLLHWFTWYQQQGTTLHIQMYIEIQNKNWNRARRIRSFTKYSIFRTWFYFSPINDFSCTCWKSTFLLQWSFETNNILEEWNFCKLINRASIKFINVIHLQDKCIRICFNSILFFGIYISIYCIY